MDLPAAWAGRPQWRVLAIGFERGRGFLAAWDAWRRDLERPRLLHFVAITATADARDLESAPSELAGPLRAQCFGLLPGLHRMAFDGGRVLLTLCVGDLLPMLRAQQFEADAIYLAPHEAQTPAQGEAAWDLQACKALARCCRRGTTLVAQEAGPEFRAQLAQIGFQFADERADECPAPPRPATPGTTADDEPTPAALRGRFDPHWQPRRWKSADSRDPAATGRCAVVGGGLAGAAVAASLARRGWRVEVLD
ncbi:MAG: FAD-dependent cmnm(5)s(2)U34 oxidoreductase, partial [Proteobacteria bacterium]|nr:FAD-dependent cmnm(5)s(2)U34 oxidoreductase [Pseudomonadota bacterium]